MKKKNLIFLIFLATHVFVILYAAVKHFSEFSVLANNIAMDYCKK